MLTCDVINVMCKDARGEEKIGRQFGALLYPVRIEPLDTRQYRWQEAEDRLGV